MKFLMILMVGACLLIGTVPAMADQAAEEPAIREAIKKLVAAWNSHDAKAHVALLDGVAVPWESGAKGTKEGQEKWFTEYFAKQKDAKGKLLEEVGIVFVTPDVAIYKSYAEPSGMVDDAGKEIPPTKMLGAWVMVKRDGKWLNAASFFRPAEE